MSNNASKQFGNRRALRNNLAERELDREIASATLTSARAEASYAGRPAFRRFVSWSGLAALDKSANAAFGEENSLPWNLLFTQKELGHCRAARDGQGPRGYYPREVNDDRVAKAARLVGWLKAAARFKYLKRAIEKSVSSRGMDSPYTVVNLWTAMTLFSPGRLNRRLMTVKAAADRIVRKHSPNGCASWQACLRAVVHGRQQTCKAATIAAAMTVLPNEGWDKRNNWFGPRGLHQSMVGWYRQARDLLARLQEATVVDTSDGVEGRRTDAPVLVKGGLEVYNLYTPITTRRGNRRFGFQHMYLVRRTADGRTFHAQGGDPKWAMKDAVRSWRQQDEAAAEARLRHVDLVDFIEGRTTGYCPLFTLDDSYRAGNCQPGTVAWMANRGWAGRDVVAGRELIPFLGDEALARVVRRRLMDDTDFAQAA